MTNAPTREQRCAPLELRARGRRLQGYAAVFNTEARIGGAFNETIRPGAFAASLNGERDILALVDHAPDKLLARTRSCSLRLAEDSTGLHFEMDLPATSLANDVLALVESRNIGGMSFGFTATDEHWRGDLRELRSVDLHEISVVSAWPAYSGTIINARSRGGEFISRSLARRYLETIRSP